MGTNGIGQRSLIVKEASALQQKTKQELIEEILTLRDRILQAELNSSNSSRSDGNRLALEAWRLLQYQEEAIRRLARERDVTMDYLSARLLFVESRLRQEQKNIEELMARKERVIEEQRRQIQWLQKMLNGSQGRPPGASDLGQRRELRQSRRRLARRFSLALEECDGGAKLSRASPCYASSDEAQETTAKRMETTDIYRSSRRARSMSELRVLDPQDDQGIHRWPSQEVVTSNVSWTDNASRRAESDESSRQSDSMDSGVSATESDDFETRTDSNNYAAPTTTNYAEAYSIPRRQSFDEYTVRNYVNVADETPDEKHSRSTQPKYVGEAMERGFNRCFGTNHRSVTKPKDVKYRKLWKIRRVVSNAS